MQVSATIFFLAVCFLAASTNQLSTSPRFSEERQFVPPCEKDLPTKLAKRAPLISAPRVIIIPLVGPATFNNVLYVGLDDPNVGDVDPEIKRIAAQALVSVLQDYSEQHPTIAQQVVLEIREVFLQETEQLSNEQKMEIPKAKKDLTQLFQNHPELQAEVENKFAELYVNSMAQGIINIPDPLEKVPNDWAHINPNDE